MTSWRRLILFAGFCALAWRIAYPVQLPKSGFKPGRVAWMYIWDAGASMGDVNWGTMGMQFAGLCVAMAALWIVPISDAPNKPVVAEKPEG